MVLRRGFDAPTSTKKPFLSTIYESGTSGGERDSIETLKDKLDYRVGLRY